MKSYLPTHRQRTFIVTLLSKWIAKLSLAFDKNQYLRHAGRLTEQKFPMCTNLTEGDVSKTMWTMFAFTGLQVDKRQSEKNFVLKPQVQTCVTVFLLVLRKNQKPIYWTILCELLLTVKYLCYIYFTKIKITQTIQIIPYHLFTG